jgi:CheY-like chemotaxis protein
MHAGPVFRIDRATATQTLTRGSALFRLLADPQVLDVQVMAERRKLLRFDIADDIDEHRFVFPFVEHSDDQAIDHFAVPLLYVKGDIVVFLSTNGNNLLPPITTEPAANLLHLISREAAVGIVEPDHIHPQPRHASNDRRGFRVLHAHDAGRQLQNALAKREFDELAFFRSDQFAEINKARFRSGHSKTGNGNEAAERSEEQTERTFHGDSNYGAWRRGGGASTRTPRCRAKLQHSRSVRFSRYPRLGNHPISGTTVQCLIISTRRMLRIRFHAPETPPSVRPATDSPFSPPARPIFMVDDDDVDRMLFQRLVLDAHLDHPCRVFSRGEDIIDALIDVLKGAPPPVACFLDVKMSGMNGFDVLRWIRCQHTLDDIAVIMLSSSDAPNDLGEALHFGAQCYVAKFPTPEYMQLILNEADRVAAAASPGPFKLGCNLLARAPHVVY